MLDSAAAPDGRALALRELKVALPPVHSTIMLRREPRCAISPVLIIPSRGAYPADNPLENLSVAPRGFASLSTSPPYA